MGQKQVAAKPPPSTSRVAKLPPRPTPPSKAKQQKQQPSQTPTTSKKTSSSSQLKLVHAPILSDDEADAQLTEANSDNEDDHTEEKTHFDVEASLSLPSNVRRFELGDQIDAPDFTSGVVRLCSQVDSFAGLSSFFQTNHEHRAKATPEGDSVVKLRLQLFDLLSSVLLEKWSLSAPCVLELTPGLLALYNTTVFSANHDHDKFSAQVIRLGKTLFMLSKDSTNDVHFCNVRYVEAILHAIAQSSNQASLPHKVGDESLISLDESQELFPMKMLIYAAGTLKNISNADDKMAKLLATNRAIAILSDTLVWRIAGAVKCKEIAQFLIQTTGILRNLSVAKSYHKQFIEAQVPARLCNVIPAFLEHQELMVNVSRILSKLTLHELPRAQINQQSANVQNLVTLVDHRQNSWLSLVDQQRSEMRFQDLLFIRMFFVLGNLCAGNDHNRSLIALDFSGIRLLLEVLQFYAARYCDERSNSASHEQEGQEGQEGKDCGATTGEQAMEVLVKLVRVFANLAINADVGAQLNGRDGLAPLLEILEVAQRVGDEELMLNAVSCITNVSYYSTVSSFESKASSKAAVADRGYCFVESNRVVITQLLSRILLDRNEEAVVEATRAFGNLSRFKDVLECMGELRVLDCLVVLLDHSNREIVHTVCGVLMNAALDQRTRRALLAVRPIADDGAIDVRSLLIGIVECAAADDLEMTLIACKALYNLLLSKDTCADGDAQFAARQLLASDTVNLRRVIDEVMNVVGQRSSNRKGIEPGVRGEEAKDGSAVSSNRQELRLVLSQLLRSVDFFSATT
ncbi:hypothetical protein BBJ28_00016008 [Nothophytophthora sp. Chile5]|nr:hypothetical protein BBJ28_00016008 [Nothophytophthora sp. Chile5]